MDNFDTTIQQQKSSHRVSVEFRLLNVQIIGNVELSEFTPEINAKYTKWEATNKERLKHNQPEVPMSIEANNYCFYPIHLWIFMDDLYTSRVSEHRILDKVLYSGLRASKLMYPNEQEVPESFTIKVSGELDDDENGNISKIRIDSSLSFALFVNVIGESGTLCLQDYGVANLYIADLIKNRESSNGELIVTLKLHTTDDNESTALITMSYPMVTVILEERDKVQTKISTVNQQDSIAIANPRQRVNDKYNDNISPNGKRREFNAGLSNYNSVIRGNISEFFMPDLLCNVPMHPINVGAKSGIRDPISPVIRVLKPKLLHAEYIELPPFKETRNIKQNEQSAQQLMSEYNTGYMEFEKTIMTEVIKGSEDINCPTNPSEETFIGSAIQVPLAAFVMTEPLHTTFNYWFRALDIYADHFLTLYTPTLLHISQYGKQENYADFVGKLFCSQIMDNEEEEEEEEKEKVDPSMYIKAINGDFKTAGQVAIEKKCSVGIGLIVQYAQMLDYNSDYTYDTKRQTKCFIESFGNAICAHNGDCEDLGYANYQFFKAFISSELEKELIDYKQSINNNTQENTRLFGSRGIHYCNLLLSIQAILRWYLPFLVIEGVTASNVQGAENKNKSSELIINGAHASLKLIPYPYFRECLKRSPEVLMNPMQPLLASVDAKIKALESQSKKNTLYTLGIELPILIGEGTGIMEGGLFSEPSTTSVLLRNFIYSSGALDRAKKPIILQDRSISPFYKTLLFGVTDAFIESLGIGTFHFAEQLGEKNKMQRSCLYSNLVKKDKKVVIIPNLYHIINRDGDQSQRQRSRKTSRSRASRERLTTRQISSPTDISREFSKDLIDLMRSVAKSRIPTPTIVGRIGYPIIPVTHGMKPLSREAGGGNRNSPYPFYSPDSTLLVKTDAMELVNAINFLETIAQDEIIRSRMGTRNIDRPSGIITVFMTRGTLTKGLFVNLLDFVKNYRSGKMEDSDNMYIVGRVNIFKEYLDETYFVYRLDFYCFTYSENGIIVDEDEQERAVF
jgi:hypothetical protein